MKARYTIKLVRHPHLPEMGQLTTRSFYDIFAVKYLTAKHKNVCGVPFWFWWRVDKKDNEQAEIPRYFIDECVATKKRFVSIPICLVSPEAPGGHANELLLDKNGKQSAEFKKKYNTTGKGTIERFEPHGVRAYDMFDDYHYEILDKELEKFFAKEYGVEYIPPIEFSTTLGPQSFERYINESGYCATWSLWYTDMRLTYPNVPRDVLLRGMYDKLDKLLGEGSLERYLVDYARQVYAVMVADFPHYKDYFINYDIYKRMSDKDPKKKKFLKFDKEMKDLVKDPLYINAPIKIKVTKKRLSFKKKSKSSRKKSGSNKKKK